MALRAINFEERAFIEEVRGRYRAAIKAGMARDKASDWANKIGEPMPAVEKQPAVKRTAKPAVPTPEQLQQASALTAAATNEAKRAGITIKHRGGGRWAVMDGDEVISFPHPSKEAAEAAMAVYVTVQSNK